MIIIYFYKEDWETVFYSLVKYEIWITGMVPDNEILIDWKKKVIIITYYDYITK